MNQVLQSVGMAELLPEERASVFCSFLNSAKAPIRHFELSPTKLVDIRCSVEGGIAYGYSMCVLDLTTAEYQSFNFSLDGCFSNSLRGVCMRTKDGIGSQVRSGSPNVTEADKLLRSLVDQKEINSFASIGAVENAISLIDAKSIFTLLQGRGPLSVSQILVETLLSKEAVDCAIIKLLESGLVERKMKEPHQLEANSTTHVYGIKNPDMHEIGASLREAFKSLIS